MAKGDDYISIGMGLDITDLKAGLQDAKSQLKLAESEFKKNTSAMDGWSESAAGMLEKVLLLTEKISYQEKQMALTRAEIERAKEQYGAASNKVKDLTAKYNDQESYLNKLKSQMAEAQGKLEGLADQETLAKKPAKELADETEALRKRLADQEVALGQTRIELDRVAAEYGDSSSQAKLLTDQIRVQEEKLDATKEVLGAYEEALDSVGDEAKETAGGLDDMNGELDDVDGKSALAGKGLDSLKAKLLDLAKGALSKAVDMLKDFIKQTIQLGIDFSSTMSSVQAITGATADEMAVLEKAARDAGSETTYSAVEAGEALKYMALAGWDAEQSTSALGGVLDLAAASGMGLAEASDAVTDYLTAFGMEAKEATRLADLLAYAQANANTSVDQLVAAYKNSAATLASSGQSVEQVTAALAVMSNAGLKGGEAGTALNAVMRDLTKRMKDGAIKIGDTSVSVVDAEGSFRDLGDILVDIGKATDGMTDAQSSSALMTSFTTEAVKALNLMLGQGADAVNGFADELTSSQGAAKKMAETMTDNLGGDIKKLNSTLDEIKLALFEIIEGPLREIVKALTEVLKHSDTVADGIVKGFGPATQSFANAAKGVDVLKGADWAGISKKASDAWAGIKNAFSGSTAWFGELRDNWKGNLTKSWDIKSTFEGVFSKVKNAFSGSTAWFGELRDNWRGMLTKGWDSVKTSFGGVFGKVKEAFSGSTKWFGELRDNWRGNLTKSWDGVKASFEGVFGKVKSAFTGSTKWFGELRDNWKGMLTKGWDSVKTSFQGVFNTVKAAFTGSTAWFGELRDNWKNALMKSWDGIKKFFEGIYNVITGVFKPIVDFFKLLFGGKTDGKGDNASTAGAVGAIKEPFSSIATFFSGVATDLKKPFLQIGDFFGTYFGKAAKAARDAFTGIVSWFTTNVLNPLKEAAKEATDIGGKVVEGIAQGMGSRSSGNAVQDAGQTAADMITKALCDALGIRSPSRLMRDKVGLMIGAGIVEGMEDSRREALREAAVWSKSLSEGLSLKVDASAVNLDMGGQPAQTTVVTYNQTINSPEPLSAGEIYRDTRSLIGRRTWA